LFLAARDAAGCRFGGLLPLDWIDLHRGQDLLQFGEDLVPVDVLSAVFGRKSFSAQAQNIFIANSILVAVVILRFGLLHGAGGEVGGLLHVGWADFDFL